MAAGKLIKEGIEALSQFALPKIEKKIRGYHGTPHTFAPEPDAPLGRFKDEAIGTGEGAQVYGRGHYIAESDDVGRNYRSALSGDNDMKIGGKDIYSVYRGIEDNAAKLPVASGEYDKLAMLEDLMQHGDLLAMNNLIEHGSYSHSPEAVDWFQKEVAPNFNRSGSLYEVNINADPERFLDWDAPQSRQSPNVLAALEKLGVATDKKGLAEFDDALLAALEDRGPPTLPKQPRDLSGSDLLSEIGLKAGGYGREARDEAAEALKQAGVPGIKYLDQGSRGSGDGTRNYVVFDPSIIEIIKKYGIAGALGAGLISPDDAKAAEQQGLGGPSDTFEGPEGTFSTPKADRLPLAASMSKQDRVPASQEGRIKEAGQMFAEVPQAMTTGLREAGESALGMGGDMGEYLPGIGPAVTASKALLPSSLNPFKTTEDAAAMTDWLQGYLPEGAQGPVKEWTQHEDTSPMDWMYRNIVANAVDPMDIGMAAGASKLGRMGLAKLKGLF